MAKKSTSRDRSSELGGGGLEGGRGLRHGWYAGHKALHTCTSWYAFAVMVGSSIIFGLGHTTAMLQSLFGARDHCHATIFALWFSL